MAERYIPLFLDFNETTQDLTDEGQEYATPDEIKHQYRLVKEFVYKCQQCGSQMHRYDGREKLRCPHCGKIAFEEINGYVHWS